MRLVLFPRKPQSHVINSVPGAGPGSGADSCSALQRQSCRTSASSLGYSQDARMDDLSGQLLWAKPILSPHSHQAQPSQSHGFLLSGAKALTSAALRPTQAAAPSWTWLPYPRPGSHKTLTQEGHGLHTVTHYPQALVLTYQGFHCLMTWGLTQRGILPQSCLHSLGMASGLSSCSIKEA